MFHKYLIEGLPVEINGKEENKIEYMELINFENKEPGKDQIDDHRAPWGDQVGEGSEKAGVWHTQGSGKSISMVCYAGKLLTSPEMKSPTLVVVTDRNDLDGQLFNTFKMASENLKQTPVQASGRDSLRDILLSKASGGIIFSTVQKFALITGEQNHLKKKSLSLSKAWTK